MDAWPRREHIRVPLQPWMFTSNIETNAQRCTSPYQLLVHAADMHTCLLVSCFQLFHMLFPLLCLLWRLPMLARAYNLCLSYQIH